MNQIELEEAEALILLKMCKTLARKLSFEAGQANIRLTRGDLTNLRGFSLVLRNIPSLQRAILMQESGLTEDEQILLIKMLGEVKNREQLGVDAATGQIVTHRHKIESRRKLITYLPRFRNV